MYESVVISTFFISWSIERIYYYCFHDDNSDKALLDLNSKPKSYPMNSHLSNRNDATYYSIETFPNNSNSSLNNNSNSSLNNNSNSSLNNNSNSSLNNNSNHTLL
jgi:hypothetical protein